MASPANLISAANTMLHFGDIKDGVEGSFRAWTNDINGWIQPTAWFKQHPGAAFPYNPHAVAYRQAMSRFQSQPVHKSTDFVTMHIMTGKTIRRR
jgi:hypothetical protein